MRRCAPRRTMARLKASDPAHPPGGRAQGLQALAAKTIWLLSLSVGTTVMGAWSHLGSESRRGAYSVLSTQELQHTGALSLVLWLGLIASLATAAWILPALRRMLGTAMALSAGLLLSGIFLTVAGVLLEQALDIGRHGAIGAVGNLIGLVLWMRLMVLGYRGCLPNRGATRR